MSMDAILRKRSILITCGTGGVGKTTLSAAIALRAALLGRKTVVITIDPAKRLATSLGIEKLGNEATDLTPLVKAALHKARKSGGIDAEGAPEEVKGTLHAIVPDTRQTFEQFVKELAPTPASADRVMRNPIFQIFAKEFSGTNEYMALERLYDLTRRGEYDCIILDTPPSRNTLAFLDAPRLLARFFEERLIKWLVLPANRLFSAGMKMALGVLEKLTGAGFMTNLFDFASALFEVQARFTANLKKITALLESEQVGFIMVTTPTPDTVPEARHFIEAVRAHRMRFDGVVVNRTLSYLKDSGTRTEGPAYELIHAIQQREKQVLSLLGRELESGPLATLPELARDVHSVEDLLHVALVLDHGFTR